MLNLHRRFSFSAALFTALLFILTSSASAQPEWDANKGNCEDVLGQPENHELSDVRSCTQIWESYRDVGALTPDQRRLFARGFSRLHYEGTPGDQSMATSALRRLGVDLLERGDFLPSGSAQPFEPVRQNTRPIEVGRSSRRAQRRAQGHNADGMEAYNDGDYASAARYFERAIDSDPWHVLAKYNLACQYSLLGRVDDAVFHLGELSRWDIPESDERMARARVDEDFIPIRDDARFRTITGYTRAQVLNGAGSAGLGAVEAIRGQLEEADVDVASYGHDRHIRLRPLIYFRGGFEDRANRLDRLLTLENVDLRQITWPSEFDIIVVFGGMEAADANPVPRPVVQGTWDGTIITADAEEEGEEAVETVEEAVETVEEWMPPDE